MNLYSVDLELTATAYIKAESYSQAMEIAKEHLQNQSLELAEDPSTDPPITGRRYEDPKLPALSLSPAMTIVGSVNPVYWHFELVEKNIPTE